MRRFGTIGFDPIRFERLDGLRDPLLVRLKFLQGSPLFDNSLVELVELMFQMGQMRFDLLETLD